MKNGNFTWNASKYTTLLTKKWLIHLFYTFTENFQKQYIKKTFLFLVFDQSMFLWQGTNIEWFRIELDILLSLGLSENVFEIRCNRIPSFIMVYSLTYFDVIVFLLFLISVETQNSLTINDVRKKQKFKNVFLNESALTDDRRLSKVWSATFFYYLFHSACSSQIYRFTIVNYGEKLLNLIDKARNQFSIRKSSSLSNAQIGSKQKRQI